MLRIDVAGENGHFHRVPRSYPAPIESLRKKAIYFKLVGKSHKETRDALGLSVEQFRDLFKPETRPFALRARKKAEAVIQAAIPKPVPIPKPKAKMGMSSRPPMVVLKDRLDSFRSRGGGVKITVEQFLEKFGAKGECYLTGFPLDWNDPASYELDHVVPWSKGGTGDLDNLRPSLPKANRMKHNHSLADFVYLCRVIADRHK